MMSGKSALILGATGATGKNILREVLASSHFNRVGEFGRRVTPSEQLANLVGKEKLVQKVIDFEKVQDEGLGEGKWDVIFITLGTTRTAAGSDDNFLKIDRDYVLNSAKAAKTQDPNHQQRLVHLSSGGASPTSPFIYMKSKGLTEVGLASLGYHDTIVFRPGFLADADRDQPRPSFDNAVGWLIGKLSYFTPTLEINVPLLAKSMLLAGILGSSGLPPAAEASQQGNDAKFTRIDNKGAIGLANSQ